MGARFRSSWEYLRMHWIAAIIIAFVIAAMVLIFVESLINGSGFNGYYATSTTRTISGSPPIITRTETYQPGKSLWDWLNLLGVLAIPVAVGLGTLWFTSQQGKVSDAENKDNQREKALQDYIDKLSELLLEKKLRDSAEEDEVRKVARVRTITILFQLDARRIGYVFAFLREAGLMSNTSESIVSLRDTDLDNINFSQAKLNGIDLTGASLIDADLSSTMFASANLSDTTLRNANLSGAKLMNAKLMSADLRNANLSDASLHTADLSDANLSRADLSGAILRGAKLYNANLSEANLREADLSGAILFESKLSKADLFGAFLAGADLLRTDITEEQLKNAKSLKGATMLDGSKHP